MAKKKKRGHYCNGCHGFLPNERFSGGGHARHICKDCKRMGYKHDPVATSLYDRKVNELKRAIKKCLVIYYDDMEFFLFDYYGKSHITRDVLDGDTYRYLPEAEKKFVVVKLDEPEQPLLDVLALRYSHTAANPILIVDYDEWLTTSYYDEHFNLPTSRVKYLNIFGEFLRQDEEFVLVYVNMCLSYVD